MPFIADLHIHSRYSRATSPELCFEQLHAWGQRKGISLIGTGDCTHPAWLAEMKDKLMPDGDGVYRLRDEHRPRVDLPGTQDVRFLITGEISTIYKADGATRKVHHVVCLPNLDAAKRFAARLELIGNIRSDGRPILGLDSRDLLETLLEASPESVLIPAHIWTPWFSVLGSKSGFDSIEACYRDLAPHIFALETGLSSDPPMNWMVSQLDRYTLVSNSDAHSPAKLGREANVFTGEIGYTAVMDALRRRTPDFWGTLEFFPEEGKYHYDGHRKCNIVCTPEESRACHGKCPVCGGALTLGVEYRVTELADRPKGNTPDGAGQFQSLLSLAEILGEIHQTSSTSKKVARAYEKVLGEIGPELHLLREAELEQISDSGGPLLAHAIEKMRSGAIHATPGYDGEYGIIKIFNEQERAEVLGQIQLFAGLSFDTTAPAQVPPAPQELTVPVMEDIPAATVQPLCLSAEQLQAVQHPPTPLIITAGPGAGKTRTLVERIKWLVTEQAISPTHVLAITFSNRATREMAERLHATLAPLHLAGQPTVATFHKLGFTIIDEHRELLGLRAPLRILSEEEVAELFVHANTESPDVISNQEALEGALSELFRDATGDIDDLRTRAEQARTYAPEYTAQKRERGALDFTDLLLLPLMLLAEYEEIRVEYQQRWQHVFVDEYQDVNVFQYLLLRLLCPPGGDLCAIGDPDQAIYGFRGADVRYFLRFQQDYPTAGQIALTRNYRSTGTIVNASSQLIAQGSNLQRRGLWSDITGPAQVELTALPTPQAEAEQVVKTIEGLMGGISHFSVDSGRSGDGTGRNLGFNDIAVLYRTHALGEAMCEALQRSGIPYQRAARADIFQRADVRKALALLTLAQDPNNRESATALCTLGLPGCAKAGGKRLAARIHSLPDNGIPILEQLQQGTLLSAEQQIVNRMLDGMAAVTTGEDSPSATCALLQVCQFLGLTEAALHEMHWLALFKRAGDAADLPKFLQVITLERDMDIYDPRAARVTLMTVHAAKGLEWDVVFMLGCEQGSFPHPASTEEEERRLFYVGMTRARTQLFLSYAQSRTLHSERAVREMTSFLNDIQPELLHRNKPHFAHSKNKQHKQLALTDLFGGG